MAVKSLVQWAIAFHMRDLDILDAFLKETCIHEIFQCMPQINFTVAAFLNAVRSKDPGEYLVALQPLVHDTSSDFYDIFPTWSTDYSTIIRHLRHHVESKLTSAVFSEDEEEGTDDEASESPSTPSHKSDSAHSSSSASEIQVYDSDPNLPVPSVAQAAIQEVTTAQQSHSETSKIDNINLGETTSQTTQSETSKDDVPSNDRLDKEKVE